MFGTSGCLENGGHIEIILSEVFMALALQLAHGEDDNTHPQPLQ